MSRSVCLSLFVFLWCAAPLAAQTSVNGTIRGLVKDEQGAVLPGVVVTATSATVPGTHQATTDGSGGYRLLDLPPGDYNVTAALAGFADARSPATMRAGANVELNIVMTVGGLNETVQVTRDAPLLETLSGGHSVNISGELLRSMPLSEKREWFGAVTLAPGVTTAMWASNQPILYVHGADSYANVVMVDGADVTSALTASLQYVGLNTDAIDDIQIKTSGVDASTPLGIGGVINVATASGSNRVSGAATLFVQPQRWNDSNNPGGTSSSVDQRQLDLSGGAPLIRDRLWAFGSYRYVDINNGIARSPEQLAAATALIPGFTPYDSTNRAHFWMAKLTGQLSANQQLSGFYQSDRNPATTVTAVAQHPILSITGGKAASARLSSVWSNRLTTRLGVSFNSKRRESSNDFADQPMERVYGSALRSGSRMVGVGRLVDRGSPANIWSTWPVSKLTASADATLFLHGGTGTHELQTGVYAQPRLNIEDVDRYANGGFAYNEVALARPGDFTSDVIPFHQTIYDSDSLVVSKRQGRDTAFYVQDAWQPTQRLTLNAGVRIDHVTWRDQLFDIETQRSWDVGPRFGLNYALDEASSRVLRAHWVRVHDQPTMTGTSVGTNTLGRRDLYDLDLDGTLETVLVSPATSAVTAGRSIDPDLHLPFIQEWGFGYGHQLPGATTVSVDFVHRDFRHTVTYLETNQRFDGSVFTGYIDDAFNDTYQFTNNRWNWPVYSSLELSATKRTARFQGIASYVRQWRHVGGTWQPHDPAGFIQPDAFPNDRGIGTTAGLSYAGAANGLSGDDMTLGATASSQWQDHTIRLGASAALPWEILLATNYTFQSGAWGGPIITSVAAPDPAFGPSTVTLANGREVANPLATTLRFAYPTRGEGQDATPHMHIWNLRVGRATHIGRATIDLAVDIFNITNDDADTAFVYGANVIFDPAYRTTQYRQLPRSAQITARVAF